MKKVFVLLIILCLTFSLMACSTDSKEQPNESTSGENIEVGEGNTEIETSADADTTEEDEDSSVEINESNELISKKIPSGYRDDLVPIVEGSEIYDGQQLEGYENTTYGIMCYSEESKDYIVEFYKGIMENAKGKTEGTLDPRTYYLDGIIEDVKVYIVIGEEDGEDYDKKYKSSFTITMEILGEDEIASANDKGDTVFEFNEEGADLPEGYPQNIVPLIKGSKIIVSTKEDVEEGELFWITAMTKMDIKEVMNFYKEIMNDADELTSAEADDMSVIGGIKDGADIAVTILPEGDDEYITTYNVVIEMTE